MSLCLDLQNFKPVESGDVQQNFWSSEFVGTWSSESSSLQKLETFIRSSCLQNLQHLIRGTIFRSWDLFFRTSCLRVFRRLHGKSSELADADYLLIRNTSLEAR